MPSGAVGGGESGTGGAGEPTARPVMGRWGIPRTTMTCNVGFARRDSMLTGVRCLPDTKFEKVRVSIPPIHDCLRIKQPKACLNHLECAGRWVHQRIAARREGEACRRREACAKGAEIVRESHPTSAHALSDRRKPVVLVETVMEGKEWHSLEVGEAGNTHACCGGFLRGRTLSGAERPTPPKEKDHSTLSLLR